MRAAHTSTARPSARFRRLPRVPRRRLRRRRPPTRVAARAIGPRGLPPPDRSCPSTVSGAGMARRRPQPHAHTGHHPHAAQHLSPTSVAFRPVRRPWGWRSPGERLPHLLHVVEGGGHPLRTPRLPTAANGPYYGRLRTGAHRTRFWHYIAHSAAVVRTRRRSQRRGIHSHERDARSMSSSLAAR